MTNSFDIVFFDAGDTLLRPHPSFPELFAKVCTGYGVEVDAARVHDIQQALAPHLIDLGEDTGVQSPSLDPDDSRVFWTYLYRRLLQELGVTDEKLVDRLYEVFSDPSSYALFDDALPALTALQERGMRLGLISNFEEWLEGMLMELEVGHLFDVTVISGIEGVEKPDPEIYRIATRRAQVEPARAVHIGDSMKTDVEPARAVGLQTVLLDRFDRYTEAPALRIRSLSELPDLLARWTGGALEGK